MRLDHYIFPILLSHTTTATGTIHTQFVLHTQTKVDHLVIMGLMSGTSDYNPLVIDLWSHT